MKRIFFASLALLAVLAATPCHAAVFERDWKAPGDGLLTYDDVNQREWLDLSVSRLDQFPEPRLENAIAELATGGLFDEFVWAKSPDVIGLALSAGVDVTTSSLLTNQLAASTLIELLEATRETSASIRSVGLLDEVNIFTQQNLGADIFVSFLGEQAGVVVPSAGDFVGTPTNGLMLYRVVPEPATLQFIIVAACAMICGCRTRFDC